VKSGGRVSGTVTLATKGYKPVLMEVIKGAQFCGPKQVSPRLIVGNNNGVCNAVIYVSKISRGKRQSVVSTKVLQQVHCSFVPHVLLLPNAWSLEVVNEDDGLHNVFGTGADGTAMFAFIQPANGQHTLVQSVQLTGKGFVAVTSDEDHPWMSGYVVPMDHPYYALTDSLGEYSIEGIPAGHYTLMMWHEGVKTVKTDAANVDEGEDNTYETFSAQRVTKYYFEAPYILSKEIDVAANGNATADFVLSLR